MDGGDAGGGTDAGDAGDAGGGMDAGDASLPTAPPTTVAMVTNIGFTSPTDAVASPDGATFYFAAVTAPGGEPAVFRVSSTPSSTPTVMSMGGELEYPTGLVLSCDGATLYVADSAATSSTGGTDTGLVFSMSTSGTPTFAEVSITGIESPQGLALDTDCATLYVTARNATTGMPGVYSVPLAGGAATALAEGAPLVAPTGVYATTAGTVYVLDHLARGTTGQQGVVFVKNGAAALTVVAEGFVLGAPGGLSATPGGGNLVVASRSATGAGQLGTVDLASGTVGAVAAPAITDPAGLRTARNAGIYAVVDSEGGAIYRAE